MEKYFDLEIITPFEIIYQSSVRHLKAPGTEGYFGILAGHEPFVTTLKVGEIKVDLERETKFFATSGGTIEVLPHKTTILVETAEEANNIDIERAMYARDRAKRRIADKSPDTDFSRARISLFKAVNRLKVAKRLSY